MSLTAKDIARLAKDLIQADSIAALIGCFLKATCTSAGLRHGVCYWRETTGESLRPIASHAIDLERLPALTLHEFDNPLVYCLRTGETRHIDHPDSLIALGRGCDELCEQLSGSEAWLVLPLFDVQRRATAALLLTGNALALRAWRADPASRELCELHDVALSGLLARHARHARAQVRQTTRRQEDKAHENSQLLTAGFIGTSAISRRLRDEMSQLSRSSLSLLITGETGSGKDHVAWLIHQASSRKGRFVPVNCAAIPKDLIEAELFGAARGAYTGATHARTGLVADADGGTLFLDEIGDMPLSLQGTLLRLLNEKKFRPVGATREQPSDFRLICATHRPLTQRVRDGLFREDLYFRICQLRLHIPPLRDRIEDVPALVSHILLEHNRVHPGHITGISDNAVAHLKRHVYPGNVRELRSLVLAAAERTLPGEKIQANQLMDLTNDGPVVANLLTHDSALQRLWHTDNLPEALAAFERLLLNDRLRKSAGSRRLAAQSLGIPKRTLARKCLEMNLNGEDTR